LAATVARWIIREQPEIINPRRLRREVRLPGLRDASKVNLAIDALVDAGWLRPAPNRDGGHSGRQRADFIVNPKAVEASDV